MGDKVTIAGFRSALRGEGSGSEILPGGGGWFGNGRTARALFYWSMASQGYWLMEFISISLIIK
ncbi:hypothetical protein C2U68_08800 [Methylomonas koyamae]|nr:hypothetical protein C2U68_08800 [Methylomonas koyamae]